MNFSTQKNSFSKHGFLPRRWRAKRSTEWPTFTAVSLDDFLMVSPCVSGSIPGTGDLGLWGFIRKLYVEMFMNNGLASEVDILSVFPSSQHQISTVHIVGDVRQRYEDVERNGMEMLVWEAWQSLANWVP
jgi:hypothetical protein